MRFLAVIFVVFLLFAEQNLFGANITWTNGNGTGIWSDAANWSGGKPGTGDKAIFDGTSTANCTIDENVNVKGIDINSGYTGTITQSGSFTITIGSDDYNQADGTFLGGSGDINLNSGTFTISNGTFQSTSGTLFFDDDFTISGGHFQHNNGTVEFDDNNHQPINLNVIDTFYNFNMDASANNKKLTIQSGDTMLVVNKLYLNQGRILSNHIIVHNELEITSGYDDGTSTLWFKGLGPVNAYGRLDKGKHEFRIEMDSNSDTTYLYDTDGSLAIGRTDKEFYLSNGVLSFAKTNTSVDWDSKEINLEAGSLIACSGTIEFYGVYDNDGTKFYHNNGTWEFNSNNDRNYTTPQVDTFYNLYIDATSNNKELILSDDDTICVFNRFEVNNGDVGQGVLLIVDTFKANSGIDNQSGSTDFIFTGNLTADYLDN